MTKPNDETNVPASAPTAVSIAVRPAAANVVPLHPLSEQQALAWLRAQPGGRITATDADLARFWGWNRVKVGRRLRAWSEAGLVKRKGSAVLALGPVTNAPGEGVTASVTEGVTAGVTPSVTTGVTAGVTDRAVVPVKPGNLAPSAGSLVTPSGMTAQRAVTRALADWEEAAPQAPSVTDSPTVTILPSRRVAPVLAIVLAALALVIAAVGVAINGWFAGNLGRTPEAAGLFMAIGVCADVLALVLPTAAARLVSARHYVAALVAWLLWCATMAFVLLASAGFAGLNIADVTAGRAREALTGQAVATRIATLQTERAAITERRSVAALEADLQAAQPAAAAVWKRSDGCRDITIAASAQACAGVLQARQRLGEAQRRDQIDAELRDAKSRLAGAPAVSSADPQVVTAAKLVNWVTAGLVTLTTADIGTLRILLLTLLPQCAGLVLMLAGLAWARRPE